MKGGRCIVKGGRPWVVYDGSVVTRSRYLIADSGRLCPRLCSGRTHHCSQLVQLRLKPRNPPCQLVVAVLQELNIRVHLGNLEGLGM